MTTNIKILKRFSVPSTQCEAEKYVGKYENFALIAAKQTAGRGRNGRSFSSGLGGLYMSVRLSCDRPATDSTLFVLFAGLAVSRALAKQGVITTLKFPNDVKFKGKKLCGIICSSTLSENRVTSVTAGIGVNVNSKIPKELEDIAISLKGLGIDKNRLAVDICEEFSSILHSNDTATLLNEYRSLSETIGFDVTVDCQPKISGKAIDIDEKGFLLVEQNGIIKKVSYGDVTRS